MKTKVEKLAYRIANFLSKYDCMSDSRIYFEGKRLRAEGNQWVLEIGFKASDFIEKANDNSITMIYEGPFYSIMNNSGDSFLYDDKISERFYNLIEKYGYDCDFGSKYSLTLRKLESN